MKGQKQYVIEQVMTLLPGFVQHKDIALVMLTKDQLEYLKQCVGAAIIGGHVEYGKDPTNSAEAYAYARSMVMNHLKKAKELNGNQVYGSMPVDVEAKRVTKALSSINTEILTDDLKEYVKTLV